VIVAGGLVALAIGDYRGFFLYEGDTLTRYNGRRTRVQYVIDGDTLVVNIPDGGEPNTHMRLWGIDAPELADPDTGAPAEPFAKKAKQAAEQLAEGEIVTLHLEPHRVRGSFGRVLAHVELPDGSRLGERLLKRGLARFEKRWRHDHYRRYGLVQQQAQTQRKGLWGEDN